MHLPCIMLFNPNKSLPRKHFTDGETEVLRACDQLRVTTVVRGRAEIQTQVSLTADTELETTVLRTLLWCRLRVTISLPSSN